MSLPREGARETSRGIVVSLTPDVCLTPQGAAMVPVPYSLVAYQDHSAANMANSVRQTGLVTHVTGSLITQSFGDEAGVGGGVTSGTRGAECEPKTWSSSVRAEGRNVVRHDDEWWMNHRNTVGRLIYTDDMGRYAGPPPSNTRYAMLTTNGPPTRGSAPAGTRYAFSPAPWAPGVLPKTPPAIRPLPPSFPSPLPPDGSRRDPAERPLPEMLRPLEPSAAPKPVPTPKPASGPGDGTRTTGRCYGRRICFNRNGYDTKEYERQLRMQQDKLNAKSPQQNVTDIDNYNPAMRKISEPYQEAERLRYIARNQKSFTDKYGSDAWEEHLNSLAALHRLDMVAGGSATDIAGMGNTNINSAIGAAWNKPKAESRKKQVRDYAQDMAEKGCPMRITLSICENIET
ncbi:PAAR-like domain-containing protein [Methylobacterium tarhaniae]|uniref:PAAR-like domain-containing protein n=1 Tax=Methylobacterium tarhaniae TaxID=1187852 RepID=UPI0009FB92B8|nr:PAAR-like domain-containing protein [Methylobacterium tarhaniae]